MRLADNPGLAHALADARHTALVYVLDDNAAGNWAMGGASRWWLHHSLHALGAEIGARGGRLILRRGEAAKLIPELAAELGAEAVHASRGFEPWSSAQERAVDARLHSAGVGLHLHLSSLLFAPEQITTKTGGFYAVYTPFSRTCLQHKPPPRPLAAPKRFTDAGASTSDRLADWQLLPIKPDWAGGLREAWAPGEAGADRRLREFLKRALADYETARNNIPAEDGTSGLSPHLHFGEISPRQAWHAARAGEMGHGAEVFLKELLWREFSAHLLWHHPKMPEQPLRPDFARLPWRDDRAGLHAWQRGHTGVPIVDAGMRQLWQTGWMHNRIRMVCASFLVKHLLISWVQGEAWFWDTLVDADLGNNSNNWQWVAGCGADAAPYFRIFNPVLQGRKFDPKGSYVRRFVPELARLPDRYLHAPWEAPQASLADAGIALGQDYPRPLIDLGEGRARALRALKTITGKNG